MGTTESKKKIQQQFEIYRIQKDGNALLKSKKDSKEYLMRVVTCASQADMDRLKTLLESRAQLKNHHILSLVEIKEKQQDFICSIHYKMYLVLQYSFKNLAQEIKQRCNVSQKNYFQESDIWSILYSCCTALNLLYSNGATHQSLTAQQIFINKDGFVKITEPLLFNLEKNHLQAMRTKQENIIEVHLSPEIIGCLQDQNFFFYDKQKSDIFVLGMIIVDISLLSNHFLYDPVKKKPLFEQIQHLLIQVGEKYSNNLVTVLGEMLKIQSRLRPNLAQIIEKVQKYNNISQDFTVQSQSNMKSHDLLSEKDQQRIHYDKPIKYQETIKHQIPYEQIKKKTQPIAASIYNGASMQQPSLSIKQPSIAFNQQNFDGRVFVSTHHQNSFSTNQVVYTYQQQISPPPVNVFQQQGVTPQPYQQLGSIHPSAHIHQQQYQPQPQPQPQPQLHPQQIIQHPPLQQQISFAPLQTYPQQQTPNIPLQIAPAQKQIPNTNIKQNFDLYQRSRSIDSIKVASVNNEYSKVDQIRGLPSSSSKPTSPFYNISNKKPDFELPLSKPKHEPIFTHQIPQIYNILMKHASTIPKAQSFSKHQQQASQYDKQHVSTPQFHAEINRVNRFTSFKNYPYETVSRSGEQPQQQIFQGMNQISLKKQASHTQSEKHGSTSNLKKSIQKTPPDPFSYNTNNSKNPYTGSSASAFKPNPPTNPFASSNPFPSNSPIPSYKNQSPVVSASFIPNFPSPSKQAQHFTCRSGFSHLSLFQKQNQDIKLQFVREQIDEKGRYEGYKYNQQRNGHGTLYFKDGGHYQGQWKNDKMHGFGKLYYQNGKIAYQGHWENDQFNGQGRVYNSEPLKFQQEFNYKDFSQLGNKWYYYQGQFKSDSKHGKGYIKLTNGEMYQGIFDHDMIQGNGIFYKRSGEIIIGFWIDNKLFLNQSYEHEKKK